MTNLVTAYQQKDIPLFQKILQRDAKDILSDPFIRTYIDTILRSIRNQVIVQVIRPYKRIELSFLAGKVGVSDEEVEELLRLLILDRKLGRNGKIDRIKKWLVFEDLEGESESEEIDRFWVLEKWVSSVDELWVKVEKGKELGGNLQTEYTLLPEPVFPHLLSESILIPKSNI